MAEILCEMTKAVQICVGPWDPYDTNTEGSHLILRVFEARTLLISNPGGGSGAVCLMVIEHWTHETKGFSLGGFALEGG